MATEGGDNCGKMRARLLEKGRQAWYYINPRGPVV